MGCEMKKVDSPRPQSKDYLVYKMCSTLAPYTTPSHDHDKTKSQFLSDDISDNNKENESDSWKSKTGIPPLYIEYCFMEKRLSSFNDRFRSLSNCSYSCEELAAGGFFYCGYEDCVRCFYCGLGLKAWHPENDMYAEHVRHRPNCRFLKVITESQHNVNYELLKKDQVTLAERKILTTNDTVTLLQLENKYLQQRYLCRMCFRNPARELLLPCGEMIICQQCSDITSTCPSCLQSILATVSVFLV